MSTALQVQILETIFPRMVMRVRLHTLNPRHTSHDGSFVYGRPLFNISYLNPNLTYHSNE